MAEKLLEADFLTLDISSIFNAAPAAKSEQKPVEDNKQKTPVKDWGVELKARLDSNRKMSQEARKNEYDIEYQFFAEFFTAIWGAEAAKNLMAIGDQLRKDIKILGFKKQSNPILAFLSLSYVQKNLIQTKLLNINTYKAIHNAIAKNLVADSEFFKANNYNILYCLDLYRKPVNTIEEYLTIQKKTLPPDASVYSQEIQDRNKRVFLVLSRNTEKSLDKKAEVQQTIEYSKLPSVRTAGAKLNELELARKVAGLAKYTGTTQGNTKEETDQVDFDEILRLLKEPEQALAALQYLSIYTGSDVIKSYLSAKQFSDVSVNKLNASIGYVADILAGKRYSKSDAERLAKQLVS